MWSEEIKRLGAAMDKLQVELAKQYRNKGGKTRPLVCKMCDVLEAIWALAYVCQMSGDILSEIDDRAKKTAPAAGANTDRGGGKVKDFCGECICRYCRWIGTDNCIKDTSPQCDHCRKGDKEQFACDGYTASPNGRRPK